MKLFLSSAGLTNPSLVTAFEKLVGLPKEQIKIAFVPTAANYESGDKDWLIGDYANLKKLGYYVDIVDISALQKEKWKPRIDVVNVLLFGGGNTPYLMYWIEKSGLKDCLPEYLKTKVYAGISAGSCVASQTITNPVQDLFEESNEEKIIDGLNLVNFQICPHLNSKWFKGIRLENIDETSKKLTEPIYVIDDNSAIVVNGNKIEPISEGVWKKFN